MALEPRGAAPDLLRVYPSEAITSRYAASGNAFIVVVRT